MRYLNLCLLVLFPIAWFAPLMRAAVLPIFGMDEISVITGLQALWATDAVLALVVTFLAVFAPMAKVAGVALVDFGLLAPRVMPVLQVMGKLALRVEIKRLSRVFIRYVARCAHISSETYMRARQRTSHFAQGPSRLTGNQK